MTTSLHSKMITENSLCFFDVVLWNQISQLVNVWVSVFFRVATVGCSLNWSPLKFVPNVKHQYSRGTRELSGWSGGGQAIPG